MPSVLAREMRPSTALSYRERIIRAVSAIEGSLEAPLRLPDLARDANMSLFHFHRVFSAIVGEPPAEYRRRLLLERAAHEVRGSRRAVAAIGREAGFTAPEAFSRAFRAQFGMPPREYRRRHESPAPDTERPGHTGRIERFAAVDVAFIRHVGPYEQVPMAFARLAEWAGTTARRKQAAGKEILFAGIAHDDPSITPAERLRFDCCIVLEASIMPSGGVGVGTLGGGCYASGVHRGSLERLGDTYAWLARTAIPANGARLRRAPFIELYLTSPETTPAKDLLTEVMLPIHPHRATSLQ